MSPKNVEMSNELEKMRDLAKNSFEWELTDKKYFQRILSSAVKRDRVSYPYDYKSQDGGPTTWQPCSLF